MATRIQLRNDLASAWSTANPILAQGEIGIESDTGRQKIGDGLTTWNSLVYSAQKPNDNALQTTSKTIVGAINELNANKQTSLVSGTNIKTINGDSLLGSGNLVISGGEGGLIKQFETLTEALNNTTLVADDVVQTLGKTTKGDGLGRKYIIKPTDNDTFLPYGSLFFNLIDEGDSTIGSVSLLAHENIPNWAVKCDGTEYLITQYPQLFAKIGNVYGGDGITTFKVPNITDYIITL